VVQEGCHPCHGEHRKPFGIIQRHAGHVVGRSSRVCVDASIGLNTSVDFLLFVAELLRDGVLAEGDVFILDNASVHYADAIADTLDELLEAKGVRMYFLPAYSPELNPCELVFAQAKYHLRRHRRKDIPFVFEIALAFPKYLRSMWQTTTKNV